MNLIIQVGDWQFEVKQIFARKAKNFGDKYNASLVINNNSGVAKIELATNKKDDTFSRQDYRDLKKFCTMVGFERADFDRFKQGIKKEVARSRDH